MENIRRALKKYAIGMEAIVARRILFISEKKELIKNTLDEIAEKLEGEIKDKLYVQADQVGRNFEYISLFTGNIPTGIERIEDKPDGKRHRVYDIELGARLFFSLAETGMIVIWGIGHNIIIGKEENQRKSKIFTRLEPKDITREIILNFVHEFFKWSITTSIRNPDLLIDTSIKEKEENENEPKHIPCESIMNLMQKCDLSAIFKELFNNDHDKNDITEKRCEFRGRDQYKEVLEEMDSSKYGGSDSDLVS
jgi:hypothetical protein